MPPKGKSNNPNGRPPGIPNRATTEFKEALNNLIAHATPKMVEWLDQIATNNPEKAFDIIAKLSEYVHPKLARTELTGVDGADLIPKNIQIELVDAPPTTKGV